MGGNISSSYQHVLVSSNGKWLILPDCGAYIHIKCIAFFVVEGERITFKLIDNDNDKNDDGWNNFGGQPISKIQTTKLLPDEIDAIVHALTELK
jgi:hypothetical protein